jgi:transketolase
MGAVSSIGGKVHQIAVRELPRSGRPEELVDKFGLSAGHIVDAVKSLL